MIWLLIISIWFALSLLLGLGMGAIINKAKLRDQRAADGVNWSIEA